MLQNAPITKRNYYFLGQTYMNINDYENGFKYNVLALETTGMDDKDELDKMDDYTVLLRIINCAIFLNKDHETVYSYVKRALEKKKNNIDVYIYYLKYCVDHSMYTNALPYVRTLAELEKVSEQEAAITNHSFYDYLRWHLISVVCFHTQDFSFGKKACERAIASRNNPLDTANLRMYEDAMRISQFETIIS